MSSELILETHIVCVTVFMLFYLLKTVFLLTGKTIVLEVFSKNTQAVEMIFSILFLTTGVWLFIITGGVKNQQIIKLALVLVSIPLAIIGFKRKNKALVSLAFLMLISAYGLAEASRSRPYPVKHASTGKELFEQNCTYCHGRDGKKGYRQSADLSLAVKDASMTASVIRNGRNNKMPAYGGLLSDEEISAVTDYVITLRE